MPTGRIAHPHAALTFFFRHMTELIKRDTCTCAAAVVQDQEGQFEQYIKDEREYVQ